MPFGLSFLFCSPPDTGTSRISLLTALALARCGCLFGLRQAAGIGGGTDKVLRFLAVGGGGGGGGDILLRFLAASRDPSRGGGGGTDKVLRFLAVGCDSTAGGGGEADILLRFLGTVRDSTRGRCR